MYSVAVFSEVFIAHSLPGAVFGPAQKIHGATLGVTIEVRSQELSEYNIVIDIGYLQNTVDRIIGELNYQNLDSLPQFSSKITTIEFLTRYLWEQIEKQFKVDEVQIGGGGQYSIKVRIDESKSAWASYVK